MSNHILPQGPTDASIYVIGDAPGAEEEATGKHFVGTHGRLLVDIFDEAGLRLADCRVATISPIRPRMDNLSEIFQRGFPPSPLVADHIREVLLPDIRATKPKILILLGDITTRLLCHNQSMYKTEGSIVEGPNGFNAIPIQHPRTVMASFHLKFPTVMNVKKAKRVVDGEVKEDNPTLDVGISLKKYSEYVKFCEEEAEYITFDIETTYGGWYKEKDTLENYMAPNDAAFESHIDLQNNLNYALSSADSPHTLDFLLSDNTKERRAARKDIYKNTTITTADLSLLKTYRQRIERGVRKTRVLKEGAVFSASPHITWFGVGHSEDYACNVQILSSAFGGGTKQPVLSFEEELLFWNLTNKLMTLKGKKYIAQNGQFDVSVLYLNNGILVPPLWMDTMIAGHCCWTGLKKSLAFLASMCLTVPAWKHTSGDDMGKYNALDVVRTHQVAMVLEKEIKSLGVEKAYKHEMSQIPPAIFLGLNGIDIDLNQMREIREEKEAERGETEKALNEISPIEVNWKSPTQVGNLLYNHLGYPVQYGKPVKGKKGITTNEPAIKKLRLKRPSPILDHILDHRGLTKMISNYLTPLPSSEGKYHSSYNITGTETGRWSSSGSIILPYGPGNLQNVPKEGRKIYKAPPGFSIIAADLKQAEAIVMAHLTGDKPLLQAIEDGRDIHEMKAREMFNLSPSTPVTPAQRVIGKKLRHAGNYGSGPGAVATALDIPFGEGKTLLNRFLDASPFLVAWQESIRKELAMNNMILESPLGRKKRFFGRYDETTFRAAYAFKAQSTIGDHLNAGLVVFYEKYGSSYTLLLQLHDAIYALYKEGELEEIKEAMRDSLVRPLFINGSEVLIDIDFGYGKTWYEA